MKWFWKKDFSNFLKKIFKQKFLTRICAKNGPKRVFQRKIFSDKSIFLKFIWLHFFRQNYFGKNIQNILEFFLKLFWKEKFQKFFWKIIFPTEAKFFEKKIVLKLFWEKAFFERKNCFCVFWIFSKNVLCKCFWKNNLLTNLFLKNKTWFFWIQIFFKHNFFGKNNQNLFGKKMCCLDIFFKKFQIFVKKTLFWKKLLKFYYTQMFLEFLLKFQFWKILFVEKNLFLEIFEVIFFENNIFGNFFEMILKKKDFS